MQLRFRVHSPFLAVKSLTSHQVYVTLPVGAIGEIIECSDDLEQPGFVLMKVAGETLFTWARDLQECSDAVSLSWE